MITTISRKEFTQYKVPPLSLGVTEIINITGSLGTGPEIEDPLPQWIFDTMQEVTEKMKSIWDNQLQTPVQVIEIANNGQKVERYIGTSIILDEVGDLLGKVDISNATVRANHTRSANSWDNYFPGRVEIAATLPLGTLHEKSAKTLQYICGKLKMIYALSSPQIDISGHKSLPEFRQYGQEILPELRISIDGIRISPQF